MARFRMRLVVVAFVGALTSIAGGPATVVTAILLLSGAFALLLRAFATHEPLLPPWLGHFDEATWYLLLEVAFRALGGV